MEMLKFADMKQTTLILLAAITLIQCAPEETKTKDSETRNAKEIPAVDSTLIHVETNIEPESATETEISVESNETTASVKNEQTPIKQNKKSAGKTSANKGKALLNEVYEHTLSLTTQHITFDNFIETESAGEIKQRSAPGTMFAKGDYVRVNTEAFIFISDGEKAYLVYPEDEEIEPTATDEASLSPADILKNYQDGYSYKMGNTATEGGKSIQYVILKPIASEEIEEIQIGVDMKTKLLSKYVQKGTNGVTNTLMVKTYVTGEELNMDMFNINSEEFSGFIKY